MKKVISLLAMMVLALNLFGCGQSADTTGQNDDVTAQAYELYTKANEEFAAAPSIAADMAMDMTMSMGEEAVVMNMEISMKQNNISEPDMQMQVQTMTRTDGVEIAMDMYYLDGFLYLEALETKTKTPMDISEVPQQSTYNVSFTQEAIEQASITQVNGDSLLEFTLNGGMVGDLLGELQELLPQELGAQANIGQVDLQALISPEGELREISMLYNLSVLMSGQTVEGSVEMRMENIEIGDVQIDFPQDLDSYMDADMSGMAF